MAQLNQPNSNDPNFYDLSFMYSKRCDLSCPFCMYSSSPETEGSIDLLALSRWLETVDYDRIASFGVYGGEVGMDTLSLTGFGSCFDLVSHIKRPKFVITNGTWSTDYDRTMAFLEFCREYDCHCVVSGTPWHRRHQNRDMLKRLSEEFHGCMTLKPKEENFHAMGKLEGKMKFTCSKKCMSWPGALRIAVQPDGDILFQNCDGIYPVVGNINQPFPMIDAQVQIMRKVGFSSVCPHYDNPEAA